ncbi:putative cytochrome P450 313b1 [Haematobia irritans]|uniref:putative cytochrome P450 313b1 n=1 Tax=Haematobia irritans TaxID=7368 RepID=UPI003F4FBEFD
MAFTSVILVTLGLVFWIYWLWSRRTFYKLYSKLPGPLGFPLIGIGHRVMNAATFLKTLEQYSLKYKTPFVMWFGTECLIYVNDPETMEKVLQNPCCTNKGNVYKFLQSAIGTGLFTSKSPKWNERRALLAPAFGRKVIESFIPTFNIQSSVLVNKLSEINGETNDLYEIIKRCVLGAACQTTMGHKMDFEDDKIIDAYTEFLDRIFDRILKPWKHPDVLFSLTTDYKRLQKNINTMNDFIGNNLKKALLPGQIPVQNSKPSNSQADNNSNVSNDYEITKSKSKIFIECVRNHFESGKLSFKDIFEETHTIIAGSFDTISTTVYFVCLCLALYPEFQEKLFNELINIFPKNGEALFLDDITNEQLDQMVYTEMVINEALRLYPTVPVVLRSASADFYLRDGLLVPKGTQFLLDILNMQRNEQFWGPKAKYYNPDLHFGSDKKHHSFAFVPFTKGLRMCIGLRYAMLHMKIIVAKIFRNFRILTSAKPSDIIEKGTISLKLVNYPYMKFEKRL